MNAQATIFTAITAFAAFSSLNAASYYIANTGNTEIIGTQRDVNTGVVENTPSTAMVIGTSYAQFRLNDSVSNLTVADMKVTLTGVVGTLDTASGTESGLMIAQTSSLNGGSQGLVDPGTLTILADFSAHSSENQSITLRFDFFEPGTSTPKNFPLELTSFDYDFRQYLEVKNSDWILSAQGSNLTKTQGGITTRFSEINGASSVTNDDKHALALNNVTDSSFDLTMGKTGTVIGYSLFMFEFRDPSSILDSPLTPNAPIPEPSVSLLSGLGLLALLRRRR